MSFSELLPLLRLFQLVSPSLPIGAYSYSQGLEWAVEEQIVVDQATAQQWIAEILQHSLVSLDGPVLVRIIQAWQVDDYTNLKHWNGLILSSRETMELLAEERHLGMALGKVLQGLDINWFKRWNGTAPAFVTPFGLAAISWNIPIKLALSAYFWSWLENQVLAAIKLVPLGQIAGQRILFKLGKNIPDYVESSLHIQDQQISGSLPVLAIASSRHETQYSRLFRS